MTYAETDFMQRAPGGGFWYLATPYSKFPGGLEEAFAEACLATARLIEQNIPVYSPIAHTHPVAHHGGMDPLDHNIWLPADTPMMTAAYGLVVCMMDSWKDSYGIGEEIKAFRNSDKTVIYMTWPSGIFLWGPPA